jgi:hypothetical protein
MDRYAHKRQTLTSNCRGSGAPIAYIDGMSQTLEKRVEKLEKRVAALTGKGRAVSRKKNPLRTFGIFQNDPDFERAARLGRKYREQQTVEKEIAGS